MTRILVVEDEPSIVAVLRQRLEREGMRVRAAASGEEGLAAFEAQPADLILLDLMLPGIDGLEVLRRLRNGGHTVPLIVLTARDEDVDVIVGLDLGADDYVVKPFNPRELAARIRAVLRRQALAAAPPSASRDPELAAPGGLSLDPARRRARFRGQSLDLRPREFDLLAYLWRHRGQVFSRQTLLSHVWGYERNIDERTVDVHVRRLRAKLVIDELEKRGFQVESYQSALGIINKVMIVVETMLGAVGGLALLVATLGIVNTMLMAVYERTAEIGILKAIGASPGDIRALFVVEAALISVVGGIVGTIGGWLLSMGLNEGILVVFRWQEVPMRGTFFVVTPWLVLLALAFATLVGLLAGLYPAARAARLDPLEALRHE